MQPATAMESGRVIAPSRSFLVLWRILWLNWDYHLSLLKRDGGLFDDNLIAAQPCLNVDGVAEIPARGNVLETQLAVRLHEHYLRPLGVEDQRGGGQVPALARGANRERDINELARKHPTRR